MALLPNNGFFPSNSHVSATFSISFNSGNSGTWLIFLLSFWGQTAFNQSQGQGWRELAERRRAAWNEEGGGEHKGHFQIPTGMVLREGRRQSICQRYTCHRGTFFFRQFGSGILGTGYPWGGAANGVGEGGNKCRRD